MRYLMANERFNAFKSFLKILLCVVLVVSLCPPFTGAFAEEADGVQVSTEAVDDASGSEALMDEASEAVDEGTEGAVTDDISVIDEELTEGTEPAEEESLEGDESEQVASDEEATGIEEGEEAGIADDASEELAEELSEEPTEEAGEEEAQPTVLSAEAEGVRAVVTIDPAVELPEGTHLVVTPLVKHDEAAELETEETVADMPAEDPEAIYDEEAAGDAEVLEGEATGEEAVAEEPVTPEPITGADVVLTGMSDAVKAYHLEKDNEEPAAFVPADAFAVEVLDGEGSIVALPKEQATLQLTIQAKEDVEEGAEEDGYDAVYAVEREGAAEDATEEEIAAAEKPVTDVAEEEYADEQEASETVTYGGKAVEVTEDLQKDEESGEITIELEGVQDVFAAKAPDEVVEEEAPVLAAPGPLRVPAAPGTIETLDTTSLGIIMNLFDYTTVDATSNKFSWDPQWRGYWYYGDGTQSGINAGRDSANQLKFYGTGDGDALQNDPAVYTGHFNNPGNGINEFTGPVGNYPNAFYTLQVANQGIVQSTLTDDTGKVLKDGTGYPKLNTTAADNSLSYLFDTDDIPEAKKVYNRVNHLFKLENAGTAAERMVYDSNVNYAYYCDEGQTKDGGDFKVYDGTYERAGGSKSGMKYGFFPFNDWGTASDCINPNEGEWSADYHPDHHLGLTMTTPLVMPYDGVITTENGSAPMVFEFSGDDDLWVFIDGKLVLDIGGIHQPVHGTINFQTGEVSLGKGTPIDPVDNHDVSYTQSQYSYAAQGISDTTVLGDTAWLWDGNGHTGILGDKNSAANRAGTTHVMQVFYLERGGCDSNLMISTNIHLMTKRTASVQKIWQDTAEADKQGITVQLIRKGISRDSGEVVGYAVVEEKQLNAGNDWFEQWTDLPSEGYNPTNIYYDNGEPNIYCDYEYLVREVPLDGFTTTYYTDAGNAINPESVGAMDKVAVELKDSSSSGSSTVAVSRTPDNPPYSSGDLNLNEGNAWQYGLGNLDIATEGGEKYAYTYSPQSGSISLRQCEYRLGPADDSADEKAAAVPADFSTVDVLNTPVTTQIDVEKEWANNSAPQSGSIWVQLSSTEQGFTPRVGELNAGNGWKTSFAGLPTKGTYTVTEGTYEGDVFTPFGDTFEVGGNSYRRISTKYYTDAQKTVEVQDGLPGTTPEYAGTAVITNGLVAADVVLKKVDSKTPEVTLEGAVFEVYKGDEFEGSTRYPDADTTFTTGSDGTVKLEGLLPGTYWVKEITAPEGYVLRESDNPMKVVVSPAGVATVVVNGQEPAMNPQMSGEVDGDGAYTLTVPNMPAYTLPSTGGFGILEFLFLGAFVMALTASISLIRRKYPIGMAQATAPTIRRR